jgi:hypothetical protein
MKDAGLRIRLEPDCHYPYMIFGWLTEEDQQAFIDRLELRFGGPLDALMC